MVSHRLSLGFLQLRGWIPTLNYVKCGCSKSILQKGQGFLSANFRHYRSSLLLNFISEFYEAQPQFKRKGIKLHIEGMEKSQCRREIGMEDIAVAIFGSYTLPNHILPNLSEGSFQFTFILLPYISPKAFFTK